MKKQQTSPVLRLLAVGMLLCLFLTNQNSFAQGVGINTTTPDASAALDLQSSDKGVLLPRVFLTSYTDKTTIPNPANALMVYNTNATLKWGTGFYVNKGNAASPDWQGVSDFQIPYVRGGTENVLFDLKNFDDENSITIRSNNQQGYALSTEGKIKIAGNGQIPGNGKVLTSDDVGNATWQKLETAPKIGFKAAGVKGGGSEVMANNEDTRIPFATEIYDLQNNYNDINASPHSIFTAPIKGIYHFDVKIRSFKTSDSDEDTPITLFLAKTTAGTISYEASDDVNAIISYDNKISTELILNAGDMIFAVVRNITGDYINVETDPDASYFNGYLISAL